jgi:hypothetical protein
MKRDKARKQQFYGFGHGDGSAAALAIVPTMGKSPPNNTTNGVMRSPSRLKTFPARQSLPPDCLSFDCLKAFLRQSV